ncbi:hypothetical protein EES43_01145 [Streptomyces sp. ADI96-02]|uniref:DUF6479 family protein n=1 Tax=unclassified Streptomyces TaxID=2593676 RepID=UPI000F54CFA0|nr:DUF6479 family protein [Streptomyces sp. ADI96-02]RPK68798.1 hypothetical protein EES43_01145 [Streptomyces sp. ADI96-02]
MDVTNGARDLLAATLADGAGALGVVLPIAAVALIALLIGGFWWGMRKRDAESPPPLPHEQPVKPEHRSHIDATDQHGKDRFPESGRALSPYELNDHGNEPLPPGSEQPRD